MNLSQRDIQQFVEDNIAEFHTNRINALMTMKLNKVLARKNPYLFKAKNIGTADELVRQLLQAYLSSQEETIFGDFLEKLSIFACKNVKGGIKSGIPNIDLEFEEDNIRYIITIKSGPNWGNSSQIKKMISDFKELKHIKDIPTSTSKQVLKTAMMDSCGFMDESVFRYPGSGCTSNLTIKEEFMKVVKETIKTARKQMGLTQQRLGEMAGLDPDQAQPAVSGWERGIRPIPRKRLVDVAKALGLGLDELV